MKFTFLPKLPRALVVFFLAAAVILAALFVYLGLNKKRLAGDLLAKGINHALSSKYAQAQRMFELSYRLKPEGQVKLWLASCFSQTDQYQKAIDALKAALTYSGKSSLIPYKITGDSPFTDTYSENPEADIYAHIGKFFLEMDKYADARDAFITTLSRDTHAKIKDLLAQQYYNLGEYDKAIEQFREIVTDQSYPVIEEWLGVSYYYAGKSDEATPYFLTAIEKDAERPEPYYYLGLIYWEKEDYTQCAQYLEKYAELSPPDQESRYDFYRKLGDAYLKTGDTERAGGAYKNCLIDEPVDRFREEGLNELEQENYALAAASFRRAIAINAADSHAYALLAQSLEGMGDTEGQERALVEAVLRSNHDDEKPFITLGEIYLGQKKYATAIDMFLRAIEINPVFLRVYHLLFEAYRNYGDCSGIITVYERMKELGGFVFNEDDYWAAGISYAVTGNYGRAREVFEEAAQSFSSSENFSGWAAFCAYASGGYEQAKSVWFTFKAQDSMSERELKNWISWGIGEVAARAEKSRMYYLALRHYSILFGFHYAKVMGVYYEEKPALDKAVEVYQRLPLKPRPPKLAVEHAQKAQELIDAGDYSQAGFEYRQAISIAPWWPQAHYNMGLALFASGAEPAAVRELKIYLALEPDGEYADNARNRLQWWESDIQAAINKGASVREDYPFILAPDIRGWTY